MNREELIARSDRLVKLVRTEYSFNQEKMAQILGVSKKTLVEIEKGRSSLGWTGSVAFCTLFADSRVLQGAFGGAPGDLLLELAFQGNDPRNDPRNDSPPPQAWGSSVWWQTVKENDACLIQQNTISQHYRLLAKDGRRLASSFDLEDLLGLFDAASEQLD